MTTGFDGISSSSGLMPPAAQYEIHQDTRDLSMLSRMPQDSFVQQQEASVLSTLKELLVQGQPNPQMSESEMADQLARGLSNGGSNPYGNEYGADASNPYGGASPYGNEYGADASNPYGNYGGMDPLEALSNEGGSQNYNPSSLGGQNYNPSSLGGQSYNPSSFGGQNFNPSSFGGQNYEPSTLGGSYSGGQDAGGPYGGTQDGGGPYGQANGGYGTANPNSGVNMGLQTGSSLSLTGDTQATGTVNGQTLNASDMSSSHDDLFNANADINGGFQIGNTVGVGNDGQNTTNDIKMTVQGHQVEVSTANGGTVTVDGQTLKAGQTAGPVTVESDGSVNIKGYNDATGAQVHANIKGNSNGGLDLTIDQLQNIQQAGGALVDQAEQQGVPQNSGTTAPGN